MRMVVGALVGAWVIGCDGSGGQGGPGDDGGVQCTDDTYEPNDTLLMSKPSGVDATTAMRTVEGSICRDDDRDYFEISVPQNQTGLQLRLTTEPADAEAGLVLTNAGGGALSSDMGSTGSLETAVQNLPSGQYYAQVFATDPLTYSLTVTRTP